MQVSKLACSLSMRLATNSAGRRRSRRKPHTRSVPTSTPASARKVTMAPSTTSSPMQHVAHEVFVTGRVHQVDLGVSVFAVGHAGVDGNAAREFLRVVIHRGVLVFDATQARQSHPR